MTHVESITKFMQSTYPTYTYPAEGVENILVDHGHVIAATSGYTTPEMPHRKLIIPNQLKPDFLRHLRRLNITARSLFPGIDGFGRSVSELVRICTHYGQP